ncbi:radical SAM protein [Caproiciproducens sp. R2]|uniref:radical SAM protein n=1 Tax=Caproiciproducens sp. R2 TaxID=3435187 RepID=UPI004034B79F
MSNDRNWREKERSLSEVIRKYPDVSPFVIIKTDVQRRGVLYTEKALAAVDPDIHLTKLRSDYSNKEDLTPVSLTMRDGTSINVGDEGSGDAHSDRDPYQVDVVDGKIVLVDEGNVIEEVSYWEKPDYYEKVTSRGTPMWHVVSPRPQRLCIHPHQQCDFWKTPGYGCKFCTMSAVYHAGNKPELLNTQDIVETVAEALKEPGRNVNIFLTGGTLRGGENFLDEELDCYIDILAGITRLFGGKRFPSQLISTAFSREQLRRLHDSTGLASYTADLEVLNKSLFEWICPGKAATIGYEEWKNRLYEAVEIFGRGNVDTGIVAGVELAQPNGFQTEEEALESTLSEADEISSHGVGVVGCVWKVHPGSIFRKQTSPSLEYYVRLARGLDQIRRKYNLSIDMDNYRRCGNHPDTDLSRI